MLIGRNAYYTAMLSVMGGPEPSGTEEEKAAMALARELAVTSSAMRVDMAPDNCKKAALMFTAMFGPVRVTPEDIAKALLSNKEAMEEIRKVMNEPA